MIYTVGGIKGGTGKTTLSTNLAVYLKGQGRKVLLVDTDYQRSSITWGDWRRKRMAGEVDIAVIPLTGKEVRKGVIMRVDEYDDIVIDAGGTNTNSQRAAITVSDVYLVPVQPSSIDIATGDLVQELLQGARELRPDEVVHAFSFLNRGGVRGEDNRQAGEVLSELQGIEFLADTMLVNRKAYTAAMSEGMAVSELKQTAQVQKATEEVTALFNLITQKITEHAHNTEN